MRIGEQYQMCDGDLDHLLCGQCPSRKWQTEIHLAIDHWVYTFFWVIKTESDPE